MNEQIMMKLAKIQEAPSKKERLVQGVKDNAWAIGATLAGAPTIGVSIDQHRRNIKHERQTGEKQKNFILRNPGLVAGAALGALQSPRSLKHLKNHYEIMGMSGLTPTPVQSLLAGTAGGALGGAIIDPLTRWGVKKYYDKKDAKQERLEKTASYHAAREMLGLEKEKTASDKDILKKLIEQAKSR